MVRSLLILVAVFSAGCTHHQLRFNTVKQAQTVGDVHTQQVLDNLAKFAGNPYALPHFSFPSAGSSQITDLLGSTNTNNFSPFRLTGWLFGFNGSRTNLESYTMTPINDPRKLELMRCVYQQVILGNCECRNSGCPNCEKRLNDFYLGAAIPGKKARRTVEGYPVSAIVDNENEIIEEICEVKNDFNESQYFRLRDQSLIPKSEMDVILQSRKVKPLYDDDSVAGLSQRTGKVTSACLSSCWFRVGKWCDVPRKSDGLLVGHYCDTYLWVPPSSRDELTKLTMVILDIAVNSPATLPASTPAVKETVSLYGADGKLAKSIADGVMKVTEVISADKTFPPKSKSEPVSADDKLRSLQTQHSEVIQKRINELKARGPVTSQEILNDILRNPPEGMADSIKGLPVLDEQPIEIPSHTLNSQTEPVNRVTPTPGVELLQNSLLLRTLTPQQ